MKNNLFERNKQNNQDELKYNDKNKVCMFIMYNYEPLLLYYLNISDSFVILSKNVAYRIFPLHYNP